jgi:hypothetical protein
MEDNKNKSRKQAVTNSTSSLHHIKISNHNYCTICKLKNRVMDKDHLLVCPTPLMNYQSFIWMPKEYHYLYLYLSISMNSTAYSVCLGLPGRP